MIFQPKMASWTSQPQSMFSAGEASHSIYTLEDVVQLSSPMTSFPESSSSMGSSNRSHLNPGVKEGQCALIRINLISGQPSPGVTQGLLLTQVRLFSPPATHMLTELQLPAAKLKPGWGRAAPPLGLTRTQSRVWGQAALEARPYLPEPLNDRVVGAVSVLVDSMLSPVIHVHIAKATHQQLERGETSFVHGPQRGHGV